MGNACLVIASVDAFEDALFPALIMAFSIERHRLAVLWVPVGVMESVSSVRAAFLGGERLVKEK